MERKLAAILSTDVKGYSRLMGEDEVATIRTIAAYRELMATLIQQHRGRVVDSPGDNLLAEFPSVVEAVQCAVTIQQELKARNAALPLHRHMEFRIGINLGDVIAEGDRIRPGQDQAGLRICGSGCTSRQEHRRAGAGISGADGARGCRPCRGPAATACGQVVAARNPGGGGAAPPPGWRRDRLAPVADLPPEVAAFSGTWEGRWEGIVPGRLVVERIDAEWARMVYAWGDDPGGRFKGGWERVPAKVLPGGRLQSVDDALKITLTFEMAQDRMSIQGEHDAAGRVSKVLMQRVGPLP